MDVAIMRLLILPCSILVAVIKLILVVVQALGLCGAGRLSLDSYSKRIKDEVIQITVTEHAISLMISSFILRYVWLPELFSVLCRIPKANYMYIWNLIICNYRIFYPPQFENEILWTSEILAVSSQTFQIYGHTISVSASYRKCEFV